MTSSLGLRAALLAVVSTTSLLLALEGPTATARQETASPAAAPPAQPNVVVVMADDMRVDELRYAPRIRRLVGGNGLTFENSFSPHAVCCPARASFFSGVYTHRHGVFANKAPYAYGAFDDSATLATALHDAGYRTGFIGKYLNGYGAQPSRVTGEPSLTYVPHGWDDWRAAVQNPGGGQVHGGVYSYKDTPFNINGTLDNGFRGQYQTNVLGDFSVDMATKFSRKEQPFFMSVNYVAPHYGTPEERDDPAPYTDRIGRRWDFETPARPHWVEGRFDDVIDRAAGLPRNGGPAERSTEDKPSFMRRLVEPRRIERAAMREVTRQRAEAIYVMDEQVGRLISRLKRLGEWHDTVMMFTSDNGYFLGEHRMREGKNRIHEPTMRVPFVVAGPGIPTGERRYDPITTIDVTATILDLAGAVPPMPGDGASKVASFARDTGWRVPVLHAEMNAEKPIGRPGFDDPRTGIGIRTSRYSMNLYTDGESELYDLVRDPRQDHNKWGTAAYRDVREQLMAIWGDLKDCHGPTCRVPLPPSLQAGPQQNRSDTRAYWAEIDRVYGF